jgi:transcriptional regulator with XRE-family HTH domain
MEEVLERIKEYRKKKGFSYETMAHELNTSAAAYRKIEMNQTKLTVERLYQIAGVLEIKIEDILGISQEKVYNQHINDNAVIYQDFENLYQDNKEKSEKIAALYEARLHDKNEIIAQLNKVIEKLS